MKTLTHQEAEYHFRQFLAGHAVPKETFQTLGSPEEVWQNKENVPLMKGRSRFPAHRQLSARRQLWLLLKALCRAGLGGIFGGINKIG